MVNVYQWLLMYVSLWLNDYMILCVYGKTSMIFWTHNKYQCGKVSLTLWSKKVPLTLHRSECWKCFSRCLRRSRVPTPHDTAWVCSSLEPCLTLCEPLLQARGCQCHRVLHLLIAPERSAYRCLPGPQEVGFGGTFHRSHMMPTVVFTPIRKSCINSDHWAFTFLPISNHFKTSQDSQVMALWQLDSWLMNCSDYSPSFAATMPNGCVSLLVKLSASRTPC